MKCITSGPRGAWVHIDYSFAVSCQRFSALVVERNFDDCPSSVPPAVEGIARKSSMIDSVSHIVYNTGLFGHQHARRQQHVRASDEIRILNLIPT
jgi:hypothetical protein